MDEKDVCPMYSRLAACKDKDCKKKHESPARPTTLLLPNLYQFSN
jgi:hypothetical protein